MELKVFSDVNSFHKVLVASSDKLPTILSIEVVVEVIMVFG